LFGLPPLEAHRIGLDDLLSGTTMLGIDRETADVFAEVRSRLRSQGQIIGDHDIWIAATAIRHDLTLLTRDGHFDRITELKRG
jgi:tRNA(fMet)-specific endonuclease VapC